MEDNNPTDEPTFSSLFKNILGFYIQKFPLILFFGGIISVSSLLLSCFFKFPYWGMPGLSWYFFLQITNIFLACFFFPVLLFSFEQGMTVWGSFKKSVLLAPKILWTFLAVSSLAVGIGLVIFGIIASAAWQMFDLEGIMDWLLLSSSAIGLLLVLFAIIVNIALVFVIYITLFENIYGLAAIRRTHALLIGRKWFSWKLFLRAILGPALLVFFFGIVFAIGTILIGEKTAEDIFSFIVPFLQYLVLLPWLAISLTLLYGTFVSTPLQSPVTENIGKKKYAAKFFTLLFIVVGMPVVIVSLGIKFASMFSIDEAPPDDSALFLSKVALPPDEENAYFTLVQAGEAIHESPSPDVLGRAERKQLEPGYAQKVSAENKEAIELFNKAAAKEQYQFPPLADPANISPTLVLPPLNNIRTLAKIALLHSIALQEEGEYEEALAQARNIVRMGYLMENSRDTLISYLVALAVKETGLSAMRIVAKESEAESGLLFSYANELKKYVNNPKNGANIFRGEYMMSQYVFKILNKTFYGQALSAEEKEVLAQSDFGEAMTERESHDNFLYLPNQTKRFFIENTQKKIGMMETPCSEDLERFVPRKKSVVSSYYYLFQKNAIGKILNDVTNAGLTSVKTKTCDTEMSLEATRFLLALQAYNNVHGFPPKNIELFSGETGFTSSLDPWSGKPFLYDSEKRMISSYGQNRTNDKLNNGEEIDWRKMKDPTFSF